MDTPIYSIIIPHKNSPTLLQRCLNSIPNNKDIQIIIVDDNSSSEIVDFEHFPGINEDNIKVIYTKDGKGAGYARNKGLEFAKGKWILFADADDYFTDDFYSIISGYSNSDSDIVFFSANSIYPETGEEAKRHYSINESVISCLNGDETYLRFHRASPIAKMINRELIEKYNINFDEVIASNDTMFSLQTGYYAKKIIADRRIIYTITVNSGSLEYSYSKDILLSRIGVDYRTNHFCKLHDISLKVRILRYILPLRHVSKRVFLKELIKYFIRYPFGAVKDIIHFECCSVKQLIMKSKGNDKSYIKINK